LLDHDGAFAYGQHELDTLAYLVLVSRQFEHHSGAWRSVVLLCKSDQVRSGRRIGRLTFEAVLSRC
jgi:hypothetical protein